MNFAGNDIFVLVASTASLPCNNNGALNSSLSHKALESTRTSTFCSRTSLLGTLGAHGELGTAALYFPVCVAWVPFSHRRKAKVYSVLRMRKHSHRARNAGWEGTVQLVVSGLLLLPGRWFSRNAGHNLPCKLSLSEAPHSANSKLTAVFEKKAQPLSQCFWTLQIWHWKLGTCCLLPCKTAVVWKPK